MTESLFTTYAEIADAANYDEARMHFNNDNSGRADNPADGVIIADALTVATCDGAVLCADCPMLGAVDCEKYQEHLRSVGEGDDYGPSFWNLKTAEIAGAYSPRFD